MADDEAIIRTLPVEFRASGTLYLIVERLSVLEARFDSLGARFASEIAQRQKSLESIDDNMRDMRRDLQSAVAAEYGFSKELATAGERIETISKSMARIEADIRDISRARDLFVGGWWAVFKLVTVLGIGGGFVGSVVAFLTYIAKR